MRDYCFYKTGSEAKGLRGVVVLCRGVLRRVLRPIFVRQAALFEELGSEIDQVAADLAGSTQREDQLEPFQWDGAALAGRLAQLEDQLGRLLSPLRAPATEPRSAAATPCSKSA